MAIGYGVAVPKPEPHKLMKARAKRLKSKDVGAVRQYVFARERNLCRCCRIRAAESMNEEPPRSLGGKVCRRDSMALCGNGTERCHGFVTRHEIVIERGILGAEDRLVFTAKTQAAADWMRIKVGESIVSHPMVQIEAEV